MNIQNLTATLQNSIPESATGTIILDGSTLQSSGAANIDTFLKDVEAYLELERGILTIHSISRNYLTVITDPVKGDILTLTTGDTSFLNAKLKVQILQIWLDTAQNLNTTLQVNILQANLSAPDQESVPWNLGISFPALFAFSSLDERPLKNSIFIYTTTVNPNWTLQSSQGISKSLSLAIGLNFYTELNLDSLSVINPVFTKIDLLLQLLEAEITKDFHLFGTIDNKNKVTGSALDFPNLNLIAPLLNQEGVSPSLNQNKTFPLFKAFDFSNPHFGIKLIEIPEDTESECPEDKSPDFYFAIDLTLKYGTAEPISLKLTTSLVFGSRYFLTFAINPTDRLTDQPVKLSIDHLAEFMAGHTLPELPDPLKVLLDDISFLGFSATFNNPQLGESKFSIFSVSITLGSTKSIALSDPCENSTFQMQWTILDPLGTPHIMTSFDAKVKVSEIGEFNVEITSD